MSTSDPQIGYVACWAKGPVVKATDGRLHQQRCRLPRGHEPDDHIFSLAEGYQVEVEEGEPEICVWCGSETVEHHSDCVRVRAAIAKRIEKKP